MTNRIKLIASIPDKKVLDNLGAVYSSPDYGVQGDFLAPFRFSVKTGQKVKKNQKICWILSESHGGFSIYSPIDGVFTSLACDYFSKSSHNYKSYRSAKDPLFVIAVDEFSEGSEKYFSEVVYSDVIKFCENKYESAKSGTFKFVLVLLALIASAYFDFIHVGIVFFAGLFSIAMIVFDIHSIITYPEKSINDLVVKSEVN